MADAKTPNKVNFGLKNAHAAVYDATAGTYATPFALPGSVSLSLDPRGDMIEFYADDMLYYSASNNQGYDGSLELSLVTQEFRVNVLGEELVATWAPSWSHGCKLRFMTTSLTVLPLAPSWGHGSK